MGDIDTHKHLHEQLCERQRGYAANIRDIAEAAAAHGSAPDSLVCPLLGVADVVNDLAHALEMNGQLAKDRAEAYSERAKALAFAGRLARAAGYLVYLRRDPHEETGKAGFSAVLLMDLPTGQVSWHIADADLGLFDDVQRGGPAWDGHDTATKWERCLSVPLTTGPR